MIHWLRSYSPTMFVKVGEIQDRPLYAIVSGNFIDKLGSIVLALTTPLVVTPPMHLESLGILGRVPDERMTSRHPDRFALLELSVEPPVDIIVGSRYLVLRRLS